jgi:hypothetical protein
MYRLSPRKLHLSAVALLAVVAGCASEPTAGSVSASHAVPLAARSNNADTDSRAVWRLYTTLSDGVTPTKIYGDGLATHGAPSPDLNYSEYQGDVCQVHAKIFWVDPDFSQSGDAVFDPNFNNTRCGVTRGVTVDLGTGAAVYEPFTNALRVEQLAVGESRVQNMPWDLGAPGCDRLVFNAESGDQVLLTRLQAAPGIWRVESRASHRAGCYNWVRGVPRYSGTSHVLPFRIEIRELPFAP